MANPWRVRSKTIGPGGDFADATAWHAAWDTVNTEHERGSIIKDTTLTDIPPAFDISGSLKHWSIFAAPGGGVIWKPNTVTSRILQVKRFGTVAGIPFDGTGGAGTSGLIFSNTNGINKGTEVIACFFKNSANHGIFTQEAQSLRLTNCLAFDNVGAGFFTDFNGFAYPLFGCGAAFNGTFGYAVSNANGTIRMVNCWAISNTGGTIQRLGLGATNHGFIVIDDDALTTLGIVPFGSLQAADGITEAFVKFVNPSARDFKLQTASPLRGSGSFHGEIWSPGAFITDLYTYRDLNWDADIHPDFGARWDIGPFQDSHIVSVPLPDTPTLVHKSTP